MFAFAGKVVSDPCLRQKDTRLILNRPFGKGRGKLYFFQVRLEMTQIESSCSPGNRRSLRPLTFPSPVVWNEVQAVLPSPFLLLSPSRPSSRAALWCVCVWSRPMQMDASRTDHSGSGLAPLSCPLEGIEWYMGETSVS